MAYDNELKFALFKNDKGDNEKRPDYKGNITIAGVEYQLSGWIAESPKAGKYIRGSAQIAKPRGEYQDRKPASQPTAASATAKADSPDDDVPF